LKMVAGPFATSFSVAYVKCSEPIPAVVPVATAVLFI
jgi:hypothetical protein